jgi:glycosyltransferase involved in cell wall biosynthesis
VVDGISIIIPTRLVPLYLDECITSIKNQKVDFEYEILIGVDSCESTLFHIKEKYEIYSGITVYNFKERVGPYCIKNNLIKYCKFDNILFFDSDDLMVDGMLNNFLKKVIENTIVMFRYMEFVDSLENLKKSEIAQGVFGLKKHLLIEHNGFENWLCNADAEFLERLEVNKVKKDIVDGIMFYRRLHNNNLTISSETHLHSKIRIDYIKKINEKRLTRNWLKPEKIFKEHEIFFTKL